MILRAVTVLPILMLGRITGALARLSRGTHVKARFRPIVVLLAGTVLAALNPACEDPPAPPPGEPPVRLEQHSATCTDVWLRVRFQPGVQPRTFEIRRNTTLLLAATIAATETLILDEGLMPNTRYTYNVTTPNLPYDYTPAVSLTTMDTTSHEWVFDPPVYFGDGTFSELVDVAIINDTLAYAVGEIYERDSLGNPDPSPHNLVKWDGAGWTLCRVPYQGVGFRSNWILTFNPHDVWLNEHAHWNGSVWEFLYMGDPVFAGIRTLKGWGPSSRDYWVVGDGGFLAGLQGTRWRRIESGTTVTINDVWGGSNPWIGEDVVLAAASNRFQAGEMRLIRISSDGSVGSIAWPMQDRRIHSVWFESGSRVFTAGGGVFQYRGSGRWQEEPIPAIFTHAIRGSGANNIWAVGSFGLVAHFNGASWRDYPGLRINGDYKSVAVTEDAMVAVGWDGNRAIIVRGTKR